MNDSVTNTMLTKDFSFITISPTSSSTEDLGSTSIDCKVERASIILRANENIHSYIRRISRTRFLSERVLTLDSGRGTFWQICNTHASAELKQDKRSWIVLKTGKLYSATVGMNWFVPQDQNGQPKLLSKKEVDLACQDLIDNIAQSRDYFSRCSNPDDMLFFPQEFYKPIRDGEFDEFKPLPNPDAFSAKLWEVSQLIIEAKKTRSTAYKLLFLLSVFFSSSVTSPFEHLHDRVDIEAIKQKYTKKEAAEMFYLSMNALLSVVVAYARVAVEISRIDTPRIDEAGKCLDCCNWEIMIDHAIRTGDAKSKIIGNQFLTHVEDAEIICATINRIAEVASFYNKLNDVIAGFDAEDNDVLLLAPFDDGKALVKLIQRAKKNLKQAAEIEKKISSDFN